MGLGLTSELSMVQPWKGLTELNKILMLMRDQRENCFGIQ